MYELNKEFYKKFNPKMVEDWSKPYIYEAGGRVRIRSYRSLNFDDPVIRAGAKDSYIFLAKQLVKTAHNFLAISPEFYDSHNYYVAQQLYSQAAYAMKQVQHLAWMHKK